jgi:large subunit ribosomal protein L24
MHARPLTYDPPAADRDFKRLYAYGWPYFKWQDDQNPGHGEQIAVRVNPATGRPIPYKMLIEPGDTVMVMRGKDKGKVTTVLKVWDKWNKILCLNANFKTKYQRPEREDEVGQKALVEEPMHVSRVMHYDEAEGKAGFIGIRFVKDPENKYGVRKERYNKATGNPIVPLDPVPEWIPVADREDGDEYMWQMKPN